MKVPLSRLAHARSGDKGDLANIGVIAWRDDYYPILLREVTSERVHQYFADRIKGPVARYELPNLAALNFVLQGALGGGGTVSLRVDAQGKTLAAALMRMEIQVNERELTGEPRGPGGQADATPA